MGAQYRTGVYYEDGRIADQPERYSVSRGINEEFYVELRAMVRLCCQRDYHQDYLIKNPGGCVTLQTMRSKKLELYSLPKAREVGQEIKDNLYPSDETRKELFYRIEPQAYNVVRKSGTERAFFW